MPSDYTQDIARGDHQRLPSSDPADYFALTDPTTGNPLDLTNRTVEFALTTNMSGGERIALTNTIEYGDQTAGEVAITLASADTAISFNGSKARLYGQFRVTGGADDPTTDPVTESVKLTVWATSAEVEDEASLLSFGALSDLIIDAAKDWGGYDLLNVGAFSSREGDIDDLESDRARTSVHNGVVNLTRLVDLGQYADILAAIEGEAASQTRLVIEPGTYTATTPITLNSVSALHIGADIPAPWRAGTDAGVEIEWDGDPTVPMITTATDTAANEAIRFQGITFTPAAGNETAGTALLSQPTTNTEQMLAFRDCRFIEWSGNPVDHDQTSASTFDWVFRDCQTLANAAPLRVPQGTEWHGGRILHNEPGAYAIHTGQRCLLTGFVGDWSNDAHGISVDYRSTVAPKNMEAYGTVTPDIAIKARGNAVSVPYGRVAGFDVGASVGDPARATARDCYINAMQFQENGIALQFENLDAADHNGCYAVVVRPDDVAFAGSDSHDLTIDVAHDWYGVTAADVTTGMRIFDRQNNQLVWVSRNNAHVFVPDGIL